MVKKSLGFAETLPEGAVQKAFVEKLPHPLSKANAISTDKGMDEV